MRRKIMAKLKNDGGVSIIFALLAVLVCSVVSIVMIRSVTASSGRFSNLSEMDQRYYSVISAAELVKDSLEDTRLTVVRTRTETLDVTQNYVNDGETVTASGEPVSETAEAYETVLYFNGSPLRMSADDIITKLSMELLFGSGYRNADDKALWNYSGTAILPQDDDNAASYVFNYTVQPEVEGYDSSLFYVNVRIKLYSSGLMELVFSSDSGDKFLYSLTLELKADISESMEESIKTFPPVVRSGETETDFTETVETVTTQIRKTDLIWKAA